ncbi:MAG TPA: AAA family ATPase [Bryobacteraceae bacterium]|mgnify:FL=1|nr:AAA family ATPase [Bryobacteraceae bacterium]
MMNLLEPLALAPPHGALLDPNRTGREASSLERGLRQLVVGQDEAIAQIVNIYQMHLTGLCAPHRPVGNFLFLGPTGSGKTRIVEATAEALTGSDRAVVKIDCAEFQHSHEIAKLIGSPPGYLGHRETHPLLSQEMLNQHHTDKVRLSFVLFDEIEKASDALWNLLLGILDKGTLTLGDNRKVDFSRTLIFLTSNLGAKEMESLSGRGLGFTAATAPAAPRSDQKLTAKLSRTGVEAARRKFTPEFMNRLDKVVVFQPLGEAELRRILDIELSLVQRRIFESSAERGFVFSTTDPAKDFLLHQGTDVKYGARHLKRAIERLLVQPLSNLIATGQIRGGDLIKVGFAEGADSLSFQRDAEGLPVRAMAEMVDEPVRPWVRVASAAIPEPVQRMTARSSRRA